MPRFFSILLIILPLCILHANPSTGREQIQQRIKPVGHVNIENKNEQIAVAKSTGQAIYEKYCITCHRDGVAGAPKFRDEASWKSRTEQRDINTLVDAAIKGKNVMPQKGTCQECTNSDIKAAIEYMIPQK